MNSTYLDPSKTHRMSNPALKAFQKNAIQSYFERQTSAKIKNNNHNNLNSEKRSPNTSMEENEVQKRRNTYMNDSKFKSNPLNFMKTTSTEHINRISPLVSPDDVPPNPPPRKPILRRTSSISEYSSFRDKLLQSKQHLSKDLLQPIIMGPTICVDDWESPQKVPERPPKNPMLRAIVCKSPELPPPPPIDKNIDLNNLENLPLPSPPPELRQPQIVKQVPESADKNTSRRNSFAGRGNNGFLFRTSTLENLIATQLPPRSQNTVPEMSDPSQRHSLGAMGNFDIKIRPSEKIVCNQNQSFKFSKMESPRKVLTKKIPDFRSSDTRLSIRKRAHNSKDILITNSRIM